MTLLLLLVISAYGYGYIVIDFIKIKKFNESINYIISIALGFGLIGHLILILGMCQLLYKTTVLVVILIGWSITLYKVFIYSRKYHRLFIINRFHLNFAWFELLMIIIILLNLIFPILTDALTPPIWWDELAYHLAVPKLYIQNHSIYYIPFIPYSNWPMESEMLSLIGLILSSEALPHLIEWFAFLLTCFLIYYISKKYFSANVGLLAATLYSLTPVVITLAGTAYVEPILTLFTVLSVCGFLEWLETNHSGFLKLSAIFAGLVASTKLNGALIPLILGLVGALNLLIRQKNKKNGLNFLIEYGSISFLIVMPWYLKNWIFTGNPFWPFLLNIFGGKNWDLLGTEYLMGFIQKPNLTYSFKNWLLGIWYLTFNSIQFGPSRFAIGKNYIFFIPLSIFAFYKYNKNKKSVIVNVILITILFYTAWFFTTHQSRFLMPTLPVMCIIIGYGFYRSLELISKKLQLIIHIILIIYLFSSSWILNKNNIILIKDHWLYLSGEINKKEYIIREIPAYNAFQYANTHLPKNAYILLGLYESRGYYLNRNYMWANPISQRVIKFEQFNNTQELSSYLKSQGFTYILFRPTGIERYEYIKYGDKITKLFITMLQQECHLIYSTQELEIYQFN